MCVFIPPSSLGGNVLFLFLGNSEIKHSDKQSYTLDNNVMCILLLVKPEQ